MKITPYEKRNYVLKEKEDFIILEKVKLLEKKKLWPLDKEIVNLIKTQLKKNWRKPLIKHLDKLIKKSKENPRKK